MVSFNLSKFIKSVSNFLKFAPFFILFCELVAQRVANKSNIFSVELNFNFSTLSPFCA